MRFALVAGSVACLFASAAFAQSAVDITRSVYVERLEDGVRALETATTLTRGDTVVMVVEWRAARQSRGFTLSSAVPREVAFKRAGSELVEISIDGGRTWGRLGALKVGERLASVEDVTHLRWRVADSAVSRGRGTLTYSAVVR